MGIDVAVLVSAGRHPASARPRRARCDARALELALGLADASIHAVHAGDPGNPALRDYLGMGLARLTLLDIPAEADPAPALIDHLRAARPALVLAGVRAESGEDSGMVPYLVAEALGYALVPGIAEIIALGEGVARVLQVLPRGQRRAITAPLPLLATVDMAAPAPRQSAFARARRGEIERLAATLVIDTARAAWETRPARERPPRLHTGGGSAGGRPEAATEGPAGQGRLLVGPSPGEAAQAIYDYLVEEGILGPPADRRPS